jgi:hypothetical protein
MDSIEIKYKTNFYSKVKTVVFSDKTLSLYCGKKILVEMDKEEINDFIYGISWIRGMEFIIGRIYGIDISNGKDKSIKIRLKSFYGINKRILNKKYNELRNKLYDFYFEEKIFNCIKSIDNGLKVEMAGVIFKKEGVCIDLKRPDRLIEWEDLNTRAYSHYYTLSSKKEPSFYKPFTYLTDWNAVIIYSISRQILKSKGLYKE